MCMPVMMLYHVDSAIFSIFSLSRFFLTCCAACHFLTTWQPTLFLGYLNARSAVASNHFSALFRSHISEVLHLPPHAQVCAWEDLYFPLAL